MTEIKKKANIDYSNSAVNLVNPDSVKADLKTLRAIQADIALIKYKIAESIPQELTDALNQAEKALESITASIKGNITLYGSYQDIVAGEYALQQRRESIAYRIDLVRQFAPAQVAYAVMVEAVDSKVMEQMIKTGKISLETARQCGEVKETLAWIIR